jgi:hypothetical protein
MALGLKQGEIPRRVSWTQSLLLQTRMQPSEAVNSSIDEVVAYSGSVVVEREASTAGFSTV